MYTNVNSLSILEPGVLIDILAMSFVPVTPATCKISHMRNYYTLYRCMYSKAAENTC